LQPEAEGDVTAVAPAAAGRRHALRPLAALRPSVLVAGVVLGAIVIVAIAAPWLPLRPPTDQRLVARLQSPNRTYLLGTDDLGRDQLSRLVWGLRISLLAAVEATAIAVAIGAPL